LLALCAGCSGMTTNKYEQFFVEWLKNHGEKNVVTDAQGVGLAGNATRLRANMYEIKNAGNGYTAELEFKIKLPDGKEIVEYLAGMGDTEEQAVNDCLANFTLTTFHVVYKAYMNPQDEHQPVEKVQIGGIERELLLGEFYARGGEDTPDLMPVSAQVRQLAIDSSLPAGTHWIKIVYGQNEEKPIMVSATLDNGESAELTDKLGKLDWPKHKSFYLVKQFILIK
jgi:hypothetical protein